MASEGQRMTPDELRLWLEQNEPPFLIRTQAGQAYPIADRGHLWIPADYEGLVCVAVRGQGVIILRIASIESVQLEHDTAAVG